MEKKENLDKVVKDLTGTGGIENAAIASRDGLIISASQGGLDSFAAMAATMFGAAETMTTELKIALPAMVTVETADHRIVAVEAGSKAIIVVQCNSAVGLGLVLNEMRKASPKVKQILE